MGFFHELMYVVGATQSKMFEDIRAVAPDNFLLVPESVRRAAVWKEVVKYGMTKTADCL